MLLHLEIKLELLQLLGYEKKILEGKTFTFLPVHKDYEQVDQWLHFYIIWICSKTQNYNKKLFWSIIYRNKLKHTTYKIDKNAHLVLESELIIEMFDYFLENFIIYSSISEECILWATAFVGK